MITLLTGENSFEVERELKGLVTAFDGEAEKLDGADVELRQLPDLLMGTSLFAEKRLVVIRSLSDNKQVWGDLPDYLERMSDDIHLVLVESSPDKRTKTYKTLQKVASVKEFRLWTERDSRQAERWIIEEAGRMNTKLDTASAKALLERSFTVPEKGQPVIDQWRIRHALEKLSVLDKVTPEVVERYIEAQPMDNVFGIFEAALRGDSERLQRLLSDLESREDPFRVFGLLSGQVFQLAVLSASSLPTAEAAKAISVHPYAAGKLAGYAKKLTGGDVSEIVAAFSRADEALKSSRGEPWTLVRQALAKVVAVVSR